MDAQPPAVVKPAPESDADFRAWARAEFQHVRQQLGRIGETLDLLLKMAQAEEEQHENG